MLDNAAPASPEANDLVARLASDLDALGRTCGDDQTVVVDDTVLKGLLARLVGEPSATELVQCLADLPGAALRSTTPDVGLAGEAPWFALADRVVVYDSEPDARISDLGLDAAAGPGRLTTAVQRRFPSLELELLDPVVVPPHVSSWMGTGNAAPLLGELCRQLGWWAALVGAVLAAHAQHLVHDEADDAAVWPLVLFLMSAAVGGWTLTVVLGCALAPLPA